LLRRRGAGAKRGDERALWGGAVVGAGGEMPNLGCGRRGRNGAQLLAWSAAVEADENTSADAGGIGIGSDWIACSRDTALRADHQKKPSRATAQKGWRQHGNLVRAALGRDSSMEEPVRRPWPFSLERASVPSAVERSPLAPTMETAGGPPMLGISFDRPAIGRCSTHLRSQQSRLRWMLTHPCTEKGSGGRRQSPCAGETVLSNVEIGGRRA
jgi:hypothetical protein